MNAGDEAIYISGHRKPQRIRVKLVRLMQGYRWNLGLYRIVIEDRWYARFFDNDKNEYSEWLVAIPAELLVPLDDKTMKKDLEKLAERNRRTHDLSLPKTS